MEKPDKVSNADKDLLLKCFGMLYDFKVNRTDINHLREWMLKLKKSLVDDHGKIHDMQTVYVRDGKKHCCGTPVKKLADRPYCERCGRFL